MKNENLLRAFGEIDENIVMEAKSALSKKIKWLGVAACLCIVVAVFFAVYRSWSDTKTNDLSTAVEKPVDNSKFPDGDNTLAILSYDKSDYYMIALSLNNTEPTIDFNVLFDELSMKPVDVEYPDCDDYIKANEDAYNKLLSYRDETLFYCFCYMLQNRKEYSNDNGAITKAELAFELALKMISGEPYDNPFYSEPDNRSLFDRSGDLIYFTLARWRSQGTEAFRKNAPGLFQLIRAMNSVPDYRFFITDVVGEIYNQNVYVNATQAFIWVLDGTDIASEHLENIPEAPKDVCNENTVWLLSQSEDCTVTLTFSDASTGMVIGKMIYHPRTEELAVLTTGIYGRVEVVLYN